MQIQFVAVTVLTLAVMATAGCVEEDPEYGSFSLVIQVDGDSDPRTFENTFGASCGLNTSFPDTDVRAGKFFLSVVGDLNPTVIMTVHWLDFEGPPPAGSYTLSDSMTFFLSVDSQPIEETSGRIEVSDEGDGLRFDLSGFGRVEGTVLCLP